MKNRPRRPVFTGSSASDQTTDTGALQYACRSMKATRIVRRMICRSSVRDQLRRYSLGVTVAELLTI